MPLIRVIKFVFNKYDNVRLMVICGSDANKCPFIIRTSWMSTERSFQVKKIVDLHTRVRNFNNSKFMNPTWLARQFGKELMDTKYYTLITKQHSIHSY